MEEQESQEPVEPEEKQRIPLPKIGSTLGSYKIVKLIGVGGMGRVYVVEHTKLGRKAALKLLLPEFAENAEVVQRFFNEARAVNQINHPNIVEIIDFVEDPGGHNYFIMELLDGKDLRKTRQADGPFMLGRTVSIGKQMASALAAAHGQGIVHRDIKPDNVLLLPSEDRPNFIKLLDFGIAKLTSSVTAEQKTRLGMVLGTPGYMSPEQAFGRPIDGRSDIYSLAVLMHWMLVDKLPAAGNLPMKKQNPEEPPPDPLVTTARGQPIPPALARIIEKCLRFDPDDRVQTMERLREELAAIAPTDIGASGPSAIVVPKPREPWPGSSEAALAAGGTGAPAAPSIAPAADLESATRLKVDSAIVTNSPAAGEAAAKPAVEPEAATRMPASQSIPVHAPAPPAKGRGGLLVGIAAAVVAVGIGLFFALRPASAPVAPVAMAVSPPPPPAPTPVAAPPPVPAPTAAAAPPAPVPAEPPQPAAAPEPVAAAAKAKPSSHHAKPAKKKSQSKVDDTTILDPLTGEPLK